MQKRNPLSFGKFNAQGAAIRLQAITNSVPAADPVKVNAAYAAIAAAQERINAACTGQKNFTGIA